MFSQQSIGSKSAPSVAAIARHLQHGEAHGDLAEGDDTGRWDTAACHGWTDDKTRAMLNKSTLACQSSI